MICFPKHISDLASRETVRDADNNLASQLGDGKETDSMTNLPDHQTDPALFAAPHTLRGTSHLSSSCVVKGVSLADAATVVLL